MLKFYLSLQLSVEQGSMGAHIGPLLSVAHREPQ